MFRKTNQSGKMTSAGANHLVSNEVKPEQNLPKEEVVDQQHNVFKVPVVKRKKLKFQRE